MYSGNQDGPLDQMARPHLTPQSNTTPPSIPTTVPSGTSSGTPGTQTPPTAKTRQTSDLVTHIARSDNHLWQALTSLQNQSNAIINNATDWTSWNPKLYDQSNNPIGTKEMLGYYMTSWQSCFMELHGTVLIFGLSDPHPTSQVQFDLPMDVGQTVIKTMTVYIMAPFDNGVMGVEIQKMKAIIYLRPSFVAQIPHGGTACKFMAGGSVGIIQG